MPMNFVGDMGGLMRYTSSCREVWLGSLYDKYIEIVQEERRDLSLDVLRRRRLQVIISTYNTFSLEVVQHYLDEITALWPLLNLKVVYESQQLKIQWDSSLELGVIQLYWVILAARLATSNSFYHAVTTRSRGRWKWETFSLDAVLAFYSVHSSSVHSSDDTFFDYWYRTSEPVNALALWHEFKAGAEVPDFVDILRHQGLVDLVLDDGYNDYSDYCECEMCSYIRTTYRR